MTSWLKTKFSRIDGLPWCSACARLGRARSSAMNFTQRVECHPKGFQRQPSPELCMRRANVYFLVATFFKLINLIAVCNTLQSAVLF